MKHGIGNSPEELVSDVAGVGGGGAGDQHGRAERHPGVDGDRRGAAHHC